MAADRVVIEELFLQLPGMSADAARAIAAAVADRVGAGLASAVPKRSLGVLELRLDMRPGAGQHEMVDAVSAAILKTLLR